MIIKSNSITLYRSVDDKVRYYSFSYYLNLFGEYILERRYGSTKNKRPTGIKIDYYKNINDLIEAKSKKIQEKLNRGYRG